MHLAPPGHPLSGDTTCPAAVFSNSRKKAMISTTPVRNWQGLVSGGEAERTFWCFLGESPQTLTRTPLGQLGAVWPALPSR